MNNKLVVGIGIAVIAIGGFLLFNNSSSNSPSANTQSNVQESQATVSPAAEAMVVTLTQDGFSPSTLNIKTGEKVTWTNNSGSSATVDSDPHPTHTTYLPLNLGAFSSEESVSLIFDKRGTFGYHNHLNPSQTGTIIVQ